MENQNVKKQTTNNILIIVLSILIALLTIVLIVLGIKNNNIIKSQNNEIEKLNNEIITLKHDLKQKIDAVAIKNIAGNYTGEQKYQNYTSKFELLLREDGTAEYCISTTNIKCNRGTYVLDGKNITLSSKETVRNEANSQAESNELIKFTYNNDNMTTQDISNNIINLAKTENKLTMTEKYFK